MDYNVDDQALVEKLTPAIPAAEDQVASAAKLKDVFTEIASAANVPALSKDIEVACTNIDNMNKAFMDLIGNDGDRDIDGTAKGMFKTAKGHLESLG